ncbi:alkaline phosphatase family protein [Arthrobacter sp. SDTb3-6]|uniref:alkaline phosphatase family protein n=1 Tax=Arthrobacter sp. SDTb3-6 TaxID=2713571 RepID=UPI00159D55B6|nr:alkaline phosphatase family protein [Arthrobacter sp. SDTb3-6]NVM99929.1 phosphoesterase [Arthrobacter sp. SDTb3-6]
MQAAKPPAPARRWFTTARRRSAWTTAAAVAALLSTLFLGACSPGTAGTPGAGGSSGTGTSGAAGASAEPVPAQPPVKHVFVIMLENVSYDSVYGSKPIYPYLANTLRPQGLLLSEFYGIAHWSLGNYLAILGGTAPTKDIQGDCTHYTDMTDATPAANGQVKSGHGCVFPQFVPTLAGQLTAKKLTWKGYMQDMGNIPSREQATCGIPSLGTDSADETQGAAEGDNYAARHNPFIYFSSVRDTPACAANVRPLGQLTEDLKSAATTPNFAFISPSLCDDGHNECSAPRTPDAWLSTWIPRIQASPAYKDSAIVIMADEAKNDSRACCKEPAGPNVAYPGAPNNSTLGQDEGAGKGGGRIGALVLSPYVAAGATSTVPYNNYSLLRSIENLFGLPYLGYAGMPGLEAFGPDVWTTASGTPSP